MTEPCYRWQDDDLILSIRVQPRASRDEIVGVYGDQLKIRLTAPPVDGKANQHLLRFLAHYCQVPRIQVELISGQNGRTKKVRINHPNRLPEPVSPRNHG
ncbi:hypothetical protein DFR30_0349 [Thiogranum longum]|uniref:UPF0235 protein DFR30_0349 n=1 Tax=Thiogranum longum TaxID=1537524 RepID=A0A4R1H7F3_9GAMM|nr:DUF167 family protein [Thiogranum longum]TCK17128.1 hypothetical protein DFR30_0349 [Thiogranum longum]